MVAELLPSLKMIYLFIVLGIIYSFYVAVKGANPFVVASREHLAFKMFWTGIGFALLSVLLGMLGVVLALVAVALGIVVMAKGLVGRGIVVILAACIAQWLRLFIISISMH
ncbi:hypothetical protein [Humidesulfovibrio mexicanus]|uniref:hypothetical protein n=1 Tax=Humidesulfovibrio mexicanus TaxID=147047 RepID=UPI0011781C41|nr:hypothetical protein [Humidesulfovibrio mexicanus]